MIALRRTGYVLLVLLLLLLSVAWLAVNRQNEAVSVKIVDDTPVWSEFFELPERVVVLEPEVAELMQAWQREHLVVATSSALSHLFPRAENLGSRQQIEAMAVAVVRPDLVILGPEDTGLARELRDGGFKAVTVSLTRLGRLETWPSKLGEMLGAKSQALQFGRLFRKELEEFKDNDDFSSVGRVLWLVDEKLTVAGKNTPEDDLLRLIGVDNIMSYLPGYRAISQDLLLSLAPDIIVTPGSLRSLLLEAVRNGAFSETGMIYRGQVTTLGWKSVFARAKELQGQLQNPAYFSQEMLDMAP